MNSYTRDLKPFYKPAQAQVMKKKLKESKNFVICLLIILTSLKKQNQKFTVEIKSSHASCF